MKKTLIIAAVVAGVSCFGCSAAMVLMGLLAEDDGSPTPTTSAPNPEAGGELRARVLGTWNRKASQGCPATAVACHATDPGVVRHWYAFADDGTYTFDAEYLPNFTTELFFQHETGTWSLEGDQLTLTPEESRWERRGLNEGARKAGGLLLKEGENPLDVVTYRAQLHYFSGLQQWNLVLSTNGATTQRDGSFAMHPDFPNGYLFAPGR